MKNKTAIQMAEYAHASALDELRRTARSLGQRLLRLADNPDPVINSLGELQGNGTMFDVLCGVVHERANALKMLRALDEDESAGERVR